jgi:hypothetical protein
MKRLSFNSYVNRHDKIIGENAVAEFDLETTINENTNEWSWPFSFHKKNQARQSPDATQVTNKQDQDETNKTKQAEAAIKNVFAYLKVVNYKKYPALKEPANNWLKVSKNLLDAIQAERQRYEASKKTQTLKYANPNDPSTHGAIPLKHANPNDPSTHGAIPLKYANPNDPSTHGQSR